MRLAILAIFLPAIVYAQDWHLLAGPFLEPTQFTLSKSLNDRALRLQMGYGGSLFGRVDTAQTSSGSTLARTTYFGMEGMIWSRLEALSQFRFPVETVDYFFGVYSIFYVPAIDPNYTSPFRIRLSHISSHLVDGTSDTTVGGSSSHYSREFISAEKLFHTEVLNRSLVCSIGLRYVFHQVTNLERTIQVPATVELGLLADRPDESANNIFLTLTTAGDPSGPSIAGVITFRSSFTESTCSDFYLSYLYGPSLEGNYASQRSALIEVGLRLQPK